MAANKTKGRIGELTEEIRRMLPGAAGESLAYAAVSQYEQLYATATQYPEALRRHLKNNIFPAAALFFALLDTGRSREAAADLTDQCFSACMEKPAVMIRKLCRIPGLYRKIPWLWKKAAFRLFGPEAGFAASMYETPASHVKFDMTACPYFETCKKLGCPEIAPVFCHTDDICYGHMHKNLIWNRSKTLARGGDCCDFDLYVKE